MSEPAEWDPVNHAMLRREIARDLHTPEGGVSDEVMFAYCATLGNQAGRGLPARIQEELSATAMEILHRRIRMYNKRRGPFRPWATTVLRRSGVDMIRAERRDAMGHAITGSDDDEQSVPLAVQQASCIEAVFDPPSDPEADLRQCFRVLRWVLDEFAWEPDSTQEVDYYAVFLLLLRLAVATRIAKALEDDPAGPQPLGPPAVLAARFLPWTEAEAARCLKPGLADLATLWRAVEPKLVATPLAPIVYATIREQGGAGRKVTADQWYHWCLRAKEAARKTIPEAIWSAWFQAWFPERQHAEPRPDALAS